MQLNELGMTQNKSDIENQKKKPPNELATHMNFPDHSLILYQRIFNMNNIHMSRKTPRPPATKIPIRKATLA